MPLLHHPIKMYGVLLIYGEKVGKYGLPIKLMNTIKRKLTLLNSPLI